MLQRQCLLHTTLQQQTLSVAVCRNRHCLSLSVAGALYNHYPILPIWHYYNRQINITFDKSILHLQNYDITQYYLILPNTIKLMQINFKLLLSPDGRLVPAWGRGTRVPELDSCCCTPCWVCCWGCQWPWHEGCNLPRRQQKPQPSITKYYLKWSNFA